jgi:hypothetical protein
MNDHSSMLGLQFDSANFDFELFPAPQDIQSWSPIEAPQGESSPFALPFNLTTSRHMNSWSTGSLSSQFQRSSSSSMTESCPLLSPMSSTQRSSYGSSVWTADTSSTLNSVYNPTLEELMREDVESVTFQTINPASLNQQSTALPNSKFSCNTILEDQVSCHDAHPQVNSEPHHLEKPPPVPPKNPKAQFLPTYSYICTDCHKPFSRKDDWRRHEEGHDPQKWWICMMTDAATLVENTGWICLFCDALKRTRDDIVGHLIKHHSLNLCVRKSIDNRKWARKDKLKQHLKQVHNLGSESTERWDVWNQDVERKKHAWGCGYCGVGLFSWKGM